MAGYIVLESKFGNPIYADDFFRDKDGKLVAPLKFRNGRATVTEARFKELQNHPRYGSEFGEVGTISDAYAFRSVRVTRSESKEANADDSGIPGDPQARLQDNRLGSPRQRAAIVKKELEAKK